MASLDDFLNAMSSQESGGNYSAVNANTGAMGRWQVMPGNVTPWAKRYLGMNITPQQFLKNPALQDKLVKAVLGSYVGKYGYRGAASAWYSGNPTLENNYNPQKWGPSVGGYVDSVMSKMGGSSFTSAVTAVADQALSASTQAARSVPGFQADPLEVGQGLIPNQAAVDRKENNVVKGIGMSVQDGSGEGQIGMETGFGIDGTDPLGLSPAVGGAGSSTSADTTGRAVLDGFGAVTNAAAQIANTVGHYSYFNPVPGYKPSGDWGKYASGGKHLALDFAVPTGTKIMAPTDGVVDFAGWDPNGAKNNGGFGLSLRIKNSDGSYVILGHLSTIAGVKVGQKVTGGQMVGLSGSTGNSTGPHLHMEFRRSEWDPSSAFDYTSLFKW